MFPNPYVTGSPDQACEPLSAEDQARSRAAVARSRAYSWAANNIEPARPGDTFAHGGAWFVVIETGPLDIDGPMSEAEAVAHGAEFGDS